MRFYGFMGWSAFSFPSHESIKSHRIPVQTMGNEQLNTQHPTLSLSPNYHSVMKRILLALFLFSAASLHAQITIKQSDMPKAGDAPYFSTSSMQMDTSAGANQTWDFPSLVPESNDTTLFSKPAGLYAFTFM